MPLNFSIRSSFAIDIKNNFDTIERESDSVLPRVRSEMKKYYQQGETGIERLHLDYRGSLNKNSFVRFEAGIVDEMFSAIGGEILFTKPKSRLASGASIHWAKKETMTDNLNILITRLLLVFGAYWATPLYDFDSSSCWSMLAKTRQP